MPQPARQESTIPLRAVAAALALAALLALAGCAREAQPGPRAQRGLMDLRAHDPAASGPAHLDGQWEFHWNRLLEPRDLAPGAAPEPTGYFTMPGTWKGLVVDGEKLGGTGQATLRLRVRLWPDARRLTLRLYDIPVAYRLWADGVLVAHSGTLGADTATERPGRSLVLAEVEPRGDEMELVLQVSNHHFRAGGVPDGIQLAPPGPLEAARDRQRAMSFLFAGCLLIAAMYHLALFRLARTLPSTLHFGIYCLFTFGYCMTSKTSLWGASLFLPPLPPLLGEYLPLFCFVAWGPFLNRFYLSLYPDEFHKITRHISDARLAAYVLLLLFAAPVHSSQYILLAMVTGMGLGIYYLQRLIVCVRRGRDGAWLLLVGSLVFLVSAVSDALSHARVIKVAYLIEPGMFLFVITQALTLARRFTVAFEAVETLSAELERKNASLRAEMDERNRLEREVVQISEEERRRISHELHDGLCQKLTGARLRAAILNRRLADTGDGAAMADLRELLDASADDAYRTSRGLWPVEHDPSAPGPSLDDLARRIAKDTGTAVHFERQLGCGQCANPNVTTLYRIAQEALANAAKHSRASEIRMELRCPVAGGVRLTVRDDGIGREAAGRGHDARAKKPGDGLGLGIMAHRAAIIQAELRIGDAPGGGTVVTCVAPCALARGAGPAEEEPRHES